MSKWDIARIRSYIDDQVEENLTLDYKAPDSLQHTDTKRAEITKDVSAMANSAGGVLIYGVREFSDPAHKHLPERVDPVTRTDFSKESLDHVVSSIRPKIAGVVIHPIPVPDDDTRVVYVVEIPQSHTAHQARDRKYYKRFNFESVPMDDYEIRDIMFRASSPDLDILFDGKTKQQDLGNRVCAALLFVLENRSAVSAKHVVLSICPGSPPSMNRIEVSHEMLLETSLYKDSVHDLKNVQTVKRDIVHKG